MIDDAIAVSAAVRLNDAVQQLRSAFLDLPLSDAELTSEAYNRYDGLAALWSDNLPSQARAGWVIDCFTRDIADLALLDALAAGTVGIWTGHWDGEKSHDPTELFRPNRCDWKATAESGRYIPLNPVRTKDPVYFNAKLWIKESEWRPLLLRLVQARRGLPSPRRGRPLGTGTYNESDAPLVAEMHQMMRTRQVQSLRKAAERLLTRIDGPASDESKISRLVRRYRLTFPREQ